MKRCFSSLCVGSLIAAASISALEYDVNSGDATVYAPVLTAAQEATFSVTDSTMSSFWDSWDEYDLAILNIEDHVHAMRGSFSDPADAGLEIKVASGGKGFYLYCKVTDDTWQMPPSSGAFAFDAVDFLFDTKSPAEIIDAPPTQGNSKDYGVTASTQQYQIFMGDANNLPTSMIYNSVDEDFLQMSNQQSFGLDTMAVKYGVKVEIVKIDATTKVMEWFVPWTHLKITDATIQEGRHIGFCAGYNDMDDATAPEAALRLKGKGDPISGGNTLDKYAEKKQYWGEIVFTASVATELRSALVLRNKANMGEIASSDFFTLQGEKIAATNISQIKNHSIVVQRSVLKDGSVVSARVPLGR
jgi:hypothetical protein